MNRVEGAAADFHALELPAQMSVWQFEVTRPAIVLGSRQSLDVLDIEGCRRAGVEIARRRSGGGVVLLVPGATEWIDIVVPVTDARWDTDVRRSMIRLGEIWVEALRDVVAGELTVHREAMVPCDLSELVCFAGVAPGEVLLDGTKLVGLSQRRSRRMARFQCAVNRDFDDDLLVSLLADGRSVELPPVAVLPATAEAIAERLAGVL